MIRREYHRRQKFYLEIPELVLLVYHTMRKIPPMTISPPTPMPTPIPILPPSENPPVQRKLIMSVTRRSCKCVSGSKERK